MMLLNRDRREQADEFVKRVRLALVTYDPRTYMPSITGTTANSIEERTTQITPINELDFDSDEGEWDFSHSDIGADEALGIIAELQEAGVTEVTYTVDPTKL